MCSEDVQASRQTISSLIYSVCWITWAMTPDTGITLCIADTGAQRSTNAHHHIYIYFYIFYFLLMALQINETQRWPARTPKWLLSNQNIIEN